MKKVLLFAVLVLLMASAPAVAFEIAAFSDVPTDSGHPDTNYNNFSGYGVPSSNLETKQLWTGTWYNNTQSTSSYLKFTLPTFSITSATLMLYNFENDAASGGSSVSVYSSKPEWNENAVTWNNQPGIGSLITSTNVGQASGWYSWNVTKYVGLYSPGDTVAFALISTDPGHSFYARESTTGFGPKLSVTTTPEPVSLVLFGLGAGVLGLTKLRRKKK